MLMLKSYEEFRRSHPDRQPLNQITIGKFLRDRGFESIKMMPHADCIIDECAGAYGQPIEGSKTLGGVGETVLHPTRTSGYSLGPLSAARETFEKKLKLRIDWEDDPDAEEPRFFFRA